MIKPEEIKNIEFEMSVLGGYKRERVDEVFAQIIADYEKLFSENVELAKKLKVCIDKIEEYQKDEKFLKMAIINAEKLQETTQKEIEAKEQEIERAAKEKAEIIVAKAQIEADNILKNAKNEAEESVKKCEADAAERITQINAEISAEEIKLQALKKEVSEFKDSVLKIYKSHLESISKLPSYVSAPSPVKTEDPQPAQPSQSDKPSDKAPEEVFDAPVNAESASKDEVETKEETDHPTATDPKPIKHDSQGEKTAEFVLDKKPDPKPTGAHFKFEDLKFGTDFDVESDE